jgi:sigma-B regulation protein RsbU (phosphoserine phosphatase)
MENPMREQRRLDLARARQVQRAFLPELRARPGVRVTAAYRPAFEVGGDFYDLVHLPGGALTALIGDVSGNGVSAALLMARIGPELRRLAAAGLGPRRLLEGAERWLAGQRLGDSFVTAACVQLARGRWVVANAGHVVPLLHRRRGPVLRLARPSGCPLGLRLPEAGRYREEAWPALPGDTLVLATDGLVGAGADLRGLVAAARGDAAALRRALFQRVDADHRRRDDATLLALTLTAPATGRFLKVPARHAPLAVCRHRPLVESEGAPLAEANGGWRV